MVFKVYIDINVLLDFFLKRRDFIDTERIIQFILDDKIDACISISVLQTLSFYLQKDFGSRTAKQLLMELLINVKLIESDKQAVMQALTSNFKDIEDAVHYFTAVSHKIDYIITNDIHFQKTALPILPVISVQQFIKKIS